MKERSADQENIIKGKKPLFMSSGLRSAGMVPTRQDVINYFVLFTSTIKEPLKGYRR